MKHSKKSKANNQNNFSWSQKAKSVDVFGYWKWFIAIFVIAIAYQIFNNIGKNGLFNGLFKSLFGGGDDPSANDPDLAGYVPAEGLTINGQLVKKETIALVDLIYDKLNGANFNSYEQYVNKLATLKKWTLWSAIIYWNHKYRTGTSMTFYQFIDNEYMSSTNWDFSSEYDPALGAFEKYGWENY